MCLDISGFSGSNLRPAEYCFANSIGESQLVRKSAAILTITFALSNEYAGIIALPKEASFAFIIPENETASQLTCLAEGYFSMKSAIICLVEGLIIVEVRILISPPAANFAP